MNEEETIQRRKWVKDLLHKIKTLQFSSNSEQKQENTRPNGTYSRAIEMNGYNNAPSSYNSSK